MEMESTSAVNPSPECFLDYKVSKSELLRGIISDRLTAAAREIFAVVERTVSGYEEEAAGLRQEIDRQRVQLEAVLQPRVSLIGTGEPAVKHEEEVRGGALPQEQIQMISHSESFSDFGQADSEEFQPEEEEEEEEEEEQRWTEDEAQSIGDQEDPRGRCLKRKLSEGGRLTKHEVLARIEELSEGQSDGGHISDISDVDCSEEESSDSEPQTTKTSTLLPAAPAAAVSTAALSPHEQAKDGTIWRSVQPGGPSEMQHSPHVCSGFGGPTDHAKRNILDPLSSFLCLLDMKMLQHIRDCTVTEAHRVQGDRSWDLSVAELKAFISMLYVRGACNKNTDLESLWSEEWGLAFYRTTMPRDRCREIMTYLRFDTKEDRHARLCSDRFALMSDVWGGFMKNNISCYKPGACITVDQQLLPTRALCSFTQYRAKTRDKLGIRFWLAADQDSKYLLNGLPYLGKDHMQPPHLSLEDSVVMELVEPYVGEGRNVTVNSISPSLTLAKSLLQRNTTLVCTMSESSRELPPTAQQQRRGLFSTRVLKHEGATLTVYQAKSRKSVKVLSTLHKTVSIRGGRRKEPDSVAFFNASKVGIDVLDQRAGLFSVRANAPRWPVAVFFNLLDMAAINAHILYEACTSTIIPRRDFILKLAKQLREEHLRIRAIFTPVPLKLQQPLDATKRQYCRVRTNCKQNKTHVYCKGCNRPVCGKCTVRVESFCDNCLHYVAGFSSGY